MLNLAGNAVKFTSIGSVEFGLLNYEQSLFYVKDTGIGIVNGNKKKIFESFWKVTSSIDTPEYRGSGLGLAIVSEYISRVSGKIWVESQINKGSSFFFVFPFEER